jgi:hypothetical protein
MMKNRATKFKMSVKIPNAVFFSSSSLVRLPEEPDTVSIRRTSFIIRPQMQVNSSTERDLQSMTTQTISGCSQLTLAPSCGLGE